MPHAKRNSLGQLPLPTTIVTSPTTQAFPALNSPTTTSPQKSHFPTLPITASNIQLHNSQFPASASSYTGHVAAYTAGGSITSPISPSSARSTHAGGIQPSASFFRPSRPGGPSLSPPTQFSRLPHMAYEESEEEEDQPAVRPNHGLAPRPHPLSIALSHSSSLSGHHHHHSNHSSELVKAHEDGNRTSVEGESTNGHGTVQTEGSRGVVSKLSKEPLLPISGAAPKGPANHQQEKQQPSTPTTKAKRVSIDASAGLTLPHSLSAHKHRLTFESLRRSMDSTASKRFSFGREGVALESGSEGDNNSDREKARRRYSRGTIEGGIPLTPRSPHHPNSNCNLTAKPKRRSKLWRTNSSSSTRSGISSAASHFVERINVARDDGFQSQRGEGIDEDYELEGDEDRDRRSSASTPSPLSFNPVPPEVGRGEWELGQTPLLFPIDPSLLPERRLERMQRGRGRRREDGTANGRTKAGSEGSLGLPTTQPTKKQGKGKGFLTFLLPATPETPHEKPPSRFPPFSSRALWEGKDGAFVKKYILHPSRNSFFLGGRAMTGGDDPWAFVLTLVVFCSIAGIWFVFVGRWWWVEGGLGVLSDNLTGIASEAGTGIVVDGRELYVVNAAARRAGRAVVVLCAYAAALVLSSMLVTAFSDPGVLPRNLDPDPPYPASSPSDGGIRAPMPRDLKVRSDVVRVKYCPTCRLYRPPRSSHCKMCDNCVDACDHHCQWVNNCIGRRNYTSFFVLLMTATLTLLIILVTSALQLFYLTRWQDLSFREALGRTPGTALVFALAVVVVWPVGALLSYHLRLLFLNVTTIEQIRNQAHKTLVPGPAPPNPFSHGNWRKNFLAVLCRPEPLSWLDGAGVATEDRRGINPGMMMDNRALRREASAAALNALASARSGAGWEEGVGIARRRRDEDEDEEEDV